MGVNHDHTTKMTRDDILLYERCMDHVVLHQNDPIGHVSPEDVNIEKGEIFINNVPEKFLKQFTLICKGFPELADTKISLKFRSISMTMQARPNIWTIMGGERKYLVFINTHRSRNGLILEDIPFNAQIGIIAHELSHILDYHFKSNWEIVKTGLWYLKKRNQENYEKAVDYLTIKKGFGHQLKDWSHFVLHEAELSKKYKKTKETYYLRPEDIHECL